MRSEVERLAQGLLDRCLTGRPIMILSGASVDHLAVQLAERHGDYELVAKGPLYTVR